MGFWGFGVLGCVQCRQTWCHWCNKDLTSLVYPCSNCSESRQRHTCTDPVCYFWSVPMCRSFHFARFTTDAIGRRELRGDLTYTILAILIFPLIYPIVLVTYLGLQFSKWWYQVSHMDYCCGGGAAFWIFSPILLVLYLFLLSWYITLAFY